MPIKKNVTPPTATKVQKNITQHGKTRRDDYAWLKDVNWQAVLKDPSKLDAAIRAHLDAENAYTNAVTAPLAQLQEELFQEMKGRLADDDSSAPMRDGPYLYYRREEAGKQYPIYCRKADESADEEVYFDVNVAADGLDFYKNAALAVSPDHTMLAIVEDTNGSEIYTLRVINIATGKQVGQSVSGLGGSLVWANDNKTLFYTIVDDNHRPCAVKRHVLGTDPATDKEVYREKDAGYFMSLGKSSDDSYIFLRIGSHTTTEWRFMKANKPTGTFEVFAERIDDEEYDLDFADGTFYIVTNKDGAVDSKICTCPEATPGRANMVDLVPYQQGTLIEGIHLVDGYLLRQEMHDALPRIIIRNLKTGEEKAISFPEEAFNLSLVGSYEYNTSVVRFVYNSPSTPAQTYDYDVATDSRTMVKQQEVPSGHNPADYVVRRLTATSHDGAQVPITVLHHKDTPIDGSAPMWLYGYGSYGHAIPASFSTIRLAMVNRGFVFAVAHIRGGTERGQQWYLDAKKDKKVNTFHDFIAAADHLIDQNYTTAGNIYAEGRSAGGLLMGAVTNMRPELWKMVHLGVPFVDVLNTISDDTLPLTPPEWPEWGNPITDAAAYDDIEAYCPYHNLEAKAYPHTLITSSLTDYRVTYWEPAKYAAKMREVNTADTLTIMKMEMATGHGGASGRFDSLRESAFEIALVLAIFNKA